MSKYAQIEGSLIYSRLAAVIGEVSAQKLCEHLGGTAVYVPAQIGADHPVAAVVGQPVAQILAQYFKGETLQLPKAHLRRQRVIELKRTTTMTVKAIALATDYTERHVYDILEAERLLESGGQLSLLDLL